MASPPQTEVKVSPDAKLSNASSDAISKDAPLGGGGGTDSSKTNTAATTNSSAQTQTPPNVTLPVFRALFGIPQEDPLPPPLPNPPIRPSTLKDRPSGFLTAFQRSPNNDEEETSIFYFLVWEERRTHIRHYLYEILTYTCLVSQLIIASALIILGALAGDHHITIAILGAITGVLTGILSLIKGQGLPMRLAQYANSLRKVREDIEFMERELRAGVDNITFDKVVTLRNNYEQAREDNRQNHPDMWVSYAQPSAAQKQHSMWDNLMPAVGPDSKLAEVGGEKGNAADAADAV